MLLVSCFHVHFLGLLVMMVVAVAVVAGGDDCCCRFVSVAFVDFVLVVLVANYLAQVSVAVIE